MYAEQGEGSNGWQAAGEARSNGWPSLQMGRRGLGDAPPLFISTPSITSESSSDLDTEGRHCILLRMRAVCEACSVSPLQKLMLLNTNKKWGLRGSFSTRSFFPEKSTTLGSLIGLRSSSQGNHSQELVPAHGVIESERRKSTGTGNPSASSLRSRTAWCPMFGCTGGSNREALGMSPSLAHLLEEERRASGSQRQAGNNNEEGDRAEYDREGCGGMPSLLVHTNTLFDEEGILPPHPSGAPLKLILQHTSPSSSYLSADWNVFNGSQQHQNRGGRGGPSHAKFSTFWPNLCGSLALG